MNDTQTSPTADRVAFEGSLRDALNHLLNLLPGAPVSLQVNVQDLDLRRPMRVLAPCGFTDALELGGFADGEDGVHLGFVTVTGLADALRAGRRA